MSVFVQNFQNYGRKTSTFLMNFCYIQQRCYCIASQNISHHDTTVNNISTIDVPKEHSAVPKNEEQRSIHVAVIGVPNVGKSTFINNLINHRVCPTSCKVHTTRQTNTAIYTRANTQLVLYDTPGLVTQREVKKHHLEQSFLNSYRHAVQHADVIGVVHDVSNSWTRNALHPTVLETLNTYKMFPSFLILNKIDTLKSKRILLKLIKTLTADTLSQKKSTKIEVADTADNNTTRTFVDDIAKPETSWKHFSDVFLVSSITGNGLSDIQEYLMNSAKDREWKYPQEAFTDDSPETLIVESVRARLLDYLPQEIPYRLQCLLEYYSVEKGTIYASVQVKCPTLRVERLICGVDNGRLRQITERVTSDLVETFAKPISLTIITSHKVDKE